MEGKNVFILDDEENLVRPGKDVLTGLGYEVVGKDEILIIHPDIPIVLCTGFSELINEDEARKLGIQRLLIKPIFLKNPAAVMLEILDKKKITPRYLKSKRRLDKNEK